MMARVFSLHLGRGPGLPKARVESLELVAEHGALGDRHAGKDAARAVLVTGLPAYQSARESGIELAYGALGENLILDIDPHQLGPGQRLRVAGALLGLSTSCTVCETLAVFDPRLPKLLYNKRGMYARVIKGGVVHIGDAVALE